MLKFWIKLNIKELKKLKIFCLIGFLFVAIFGALSHFFYDWSGKNEIIGILFPANESTWEHLKLAIFPTFLYFLFGTFFLKNKNYVFAMFITSLIPLILIPSIFYFYTSLTGKPVLIIDILTYFVSVLISWVVCYFILKSNISTSKFNYIFILGIIAIMFCYLTFTLFPPQNFLFKDPNNFYGLKK